MTKEAFIQSLKDKKMPDGLSPELTAMWHEGIDDWDTAHQMVQHEPGEDAARIHAYLHRKEGDLNNAEYWYNKAGLENPNKDLQQEYDDILEYLLNKLSHCMIDF